MRRITRLFPSFRTRNLAVLNPLTGASSLVESLPVVLENDPESDARGAGNPPSVEFVRSGPDLVLVPSATGSLVRLNSDEITTPTPSNRVRAKRSGG